MSGIIKYKNITKPVLLSELLRQSGIPLGMPCGGKGTCGKCKVKVFGKVSELSEVEKRLLTKHETGAFIRLACLTYALGDVEIKLLADEYIAPFFEENKKTTINAKRIGAAVDIGTTTITAAIYNIQKKQLLACDTKLNPQNAFGADVISRLQNAVEGKGKALQTAVCKQIVSMLYELNPKAVPYEQIVLTGNTAMLYLLTNKNPKAITLAPFKANCLFGVEIESKRLPGFSELCDFVYLPRCVSAFVGGDMTAAAMDSLKRFKFLNKDGKVRVLADIGTNGELMLSQNGKLFCCSTAAGPAFEGATLYNGSVAKRGAINSLSYSACKITHTVIGNEKATGICGSGVVDAIAVMISAGIIDETGLILNKGHNYIPYISDINGANAFNIPNTDVFITQEDIRNIQLAKAAIYAGIVTLIASVNIKVEKVDTLILAGGFGGSININSAIKIGLIPKAFRHKTLVSGNSALKGSALLLSDLKLRDFSKNMADSANSVELSTSAKFFEEYIMGMSF